MGKTIFLLFVLVTAQLLWPSTILAQSAVVNATVRIEQTPTPVPSGGGGGGGGGGSIITAQTIVNFSGRAYPQSKVTLLKDAQIAASTVASGSDFFFSLNGLSSGKYIFSLYAEDKDGRRSSLLTFPVSVTTGTTTNVSGIFIAPTIALNKAEVKKGDDLTIFGQTSPGAEVLVNVNSEQEFFGKTLANNSGIYLYNFNTADLELGSHSARSKSSASDNLISGYSYTLSFKVGNKSIAVDEENGAIVYDLNNDNRLNLVDFSILAYWYRRQGFPAGADLNKDNKIDLVDFSIMAFYWTG
jgi:hypothetical protein